MRKELPINGMARTLLPKTVKQSFLIAEGRILEKTFCFSKRYAYTEDRAANLDVLFKEEIIRAVGLVGHGQAEVIYGLARDFFPWGHGLLTWQEQQHILEIAGALAAVLYMKENEEA